MEQTFCLRVKVYLLQIPSSADTLRHYGCLLM